MKWPFLFSIPHCGRTIPPEVRNHYILEEPDQFWDSDAWTDIIYDFGKMSAAVFTADIARAIVDLNRPPDLGTNNPDGVVKTATCLGRNIYGAELPIQLKKQLLERYFFPYHNKIADRLSRNDILFSFDCHSMLRYAPIVENGVNKERPFFCVSNDHNSTCTAEQLKALANCIEEVFSLKKSEIGINEPFSGGHIIKTYGTHQTPWIQVEINRKMYLDDSGSKTHPKILQELNRKLESVFALFAGRMLPQIPS